MNTELTVEARARVHAALGDPTRLTMVDSLILGDLSPSELGRQLDLPTNLVAHHLKVLEDAGLVVRGPSEGDRRRTYVRLVPVALLSLTAGLPRQVRRVVFVCTHNSARSQLASALWAQRSPVPSTSAGTQPAARVHPRAVKVARRHGLTIDGARTAHVTDVLSSDDFVVAVCDNAHEHFPADARPAAHWSVPDPAPADTDAAFEAAYAQISLRIDRLAPILRTGVDDD
jgi:protein-tyrosine-phosphatase